MVKKRSEEAQDPRSSRQARGLRLKSIRQSLDLSRQDFSQKFGISVYTLQNWETNKNGGLGEERAAKVVNLLKQAGVQCTFEWMLHGIGTAPTIADPTSNITSTTPLESSKSDELTLIAKELNLLREHYPQQIMDMIVGDDGMEPIYVVGEYIAGLKHFKEKITDCIGKNCIIQTFEGDILVRQIKPGSMPEHYTLICTNPNTLIAKPFLYDVKLVMAAPVIWTRRRIL